MWAYEQGWREEVERGTTEGRGDGGRGVGERWLRNYFKESPPIKRP